MFLLCGGLLFGQASAPQAKANPSPAQGPAAPTGVSVKTESQVAPGDPVITVKGVCEDASKQGDDCKTVVTREQFEKMANALQPGMSPPIRRQLAMTYSRLLLMSSAAEKKGLDKSQQFEQMMLYSRMQVLSQALGRALQEEGNNVSDADIEKSYNDNKVAYEEATLERIFIPHTKQILPTPKAKPGAAKTAPRMSPEEQEQASEALMKKLATTIHLRAAKGESFDALQKEVYLVANVKNSTTSTKMEKTRQNMLPPAQKSVMELKPGEVSELYADPSGYYIYKMVRKETLPLDSVKSEIHSAIASQRYRDAMQVFQLGPNMDLSEAYFGASKKPNTPSPQKGDQPPVDADDDPD
jgi:hypothetical protein